MTGFKDHFSTRAAGYAAFRPRYPAALFAWLATLVRQHDLAWDAGTGNGQAAVDLARYFRAVIATDASENQIGQAEPHERVRYAVGNARASGLDTASCDLVTAAQALHWFDIPAFFGEARRVLKPGGALAVWTYAQPSMDDPACNAILQRYVQLMDPWWPPERAMVEDGYRSIDVPFREITAPPLEVEQQATREALVGYLRTWSAHQRYIAEHEDPVAEVERDFMTVWSGGTRRVRWPLFVRAGYPR